MGQFETKYNEIMNESIREWRKADLVKDGKIIQGDVDVYDKNGQTLLTKEGQIEDKSAYLKVKRGDFEYETTIDGWDYWKII